jgi:hypothetical protein
MSSVVARLHNAMNQHDLEAFVGYFDPGYQSEQPVHPGRGFGGRDQVRKNWSGIFESFPDFKAELLRHTTDGDTMWAEWHWTATGLNMRGVTIMGVEEERIVWGRLYMESVEGTEETIDEAVQRMTTGNPSRKNTPPDSSSR